MKKSIFLIGSGIIILLSSCAKEKSQNANQDSIYSIYELFYNHSTDVTTAQATFRFGGPTGTLLQLSDPASATFNGDKLLYNSVSGVHNKQYAGLVKSGTYVYKDLDNNTFTNQTPVMDTIAFTTALDTIHSDSAFTFTWVGNPVAANETITLTIDGTQQNNFEVFSTSTNGATQLVLAANKLQQLGLGNATCTLQRTYNKSTIAEGTSKGGRMAVWYTIKKTVYIK